jgi:hypothetical protein
MTDTVEAPLVYTPEQELEAVKKELPEKRGEYRRIHPLFTNHYRVNFHNDETNIITRSYFVRVSGVKITY